jgi:hypothetical protein
MESKKLKVFLKVIFLNLIFVSYISAENITTAPLINLDEIQPTYDEDSIDTTGNDEVNSIATQNDKKYDNSFVTISLLNKITAEVISIDINLKQSHIYKELNIYPIDCYNSDPMDKRETAVYLNIYKQQSMEKIFNGWMIKSLPSVSSMEHPIYDIWVNSCYKL